MKRNTIVADLSTYSKSPNADPFLFLTESQDVAAIKDRLGPDALEFDAFFVRVDKGEYTEIYGMDGIVPLLEKQLVRLRVN